MYPRYAPSRPSSELNRDHNAGRLVCRLVTILPTAVDTTLKVVGEEIERRLQNRARYGAEYPGKPVSTPERASARRNLTPRKFDFLSWIIDAVPDEDRNLRHVCIMLMINNLGAIHTSSSVSWQGQSGSAEC